MRGPAPFYGCHCPGTHHYIPVKVLGRSPGVAQGSGLHCSVGGGGGGGGGGGVIEDTAIKDYSSNDPKQMVNLFEGYSLDQSCFSA